MRNWLPALLTASLLALPLAGAHDFNHAPFTRHEDCGVWSAPQGHAVGDGHVHTHDRAYADSTAVKMHDHDPCKQIGMDYPTVNLAAGPVNGDAPAILPIGAPNPAPYQLQEISLEEAALPDQDADLAAKTTKVIINGEAWRIPVRPEDVQKQTNLVFAGDNSFRAMGVPGRGTAAEPYVLEGKIVTNTLTVKDTTACVVVRNSFIDSDVIRAPILTDPIVVLEDLRAYMEALKAETLALMEELLEEKAVWDAEKAAEDAAMAALEGELDAFEAEQAAWDAAWADYESAYADAVALYESLSADFEAYAANYQNAPAPSPDYQGVSDPQAFEAAFEAYAEEVEDYVLGSPPPSTPPSGWSQQSWDTYKAQYDAYVADVDQASDDLAALQLTEPSQEEYEAFLAAYAAFLADEYGPGAESYDAFLAEFTAFLAGFNASKHELDADLAAVAAWEAKVADYTLEYATATKTYLAKTLDDLIQQVLSDLRKLLNPADTGRLVLDWNGQCVRAYHNVLEDLRVNQNNDRTGYATGGIIEDNRIYTIGQIRHYDGIVRDNEIGNRAHLQSLVDPGVKAPAGDRSINNDGANEGLFVENVIYGQVDLDLHGHHHGAGFFTPESHYHGSNTKESYMWNADGTPKKFPDGSMKPHHDHSKRWTSVLFQDNVVVDPKGVGLRYEDQAHRTDDERANSENMNELKRPHTHRTWVDIEGNVVVGPMVVDVFNADGTWLWSDTWTEPKTDLVGRITDAIQHMGAEIVNSHQARNDGWVDVKGNTVFLVGSGSAFRAVQTKEMEQLDIAGNKAFLLGSGFDSGLDAAGLLEHFRDVHAIPSTDTVAVNAAYTGLAAWGGTKNAAASQAFLLVNSKDSYVHVCENGVRGFGRGLVATDRIYEDVDIETCPQNGWGDANPAISVAWTPYPPPGPVCTEDLRAVTDPTVTEYVVKPTYEVVDGSAVCPVVDALTPILPSNPAGAVQPLVDWAADTVNTVAQNPPPGLPTPPVSIPKL